MQVEVLAAKAAKERLQQSGGKGSKKDSMRDQLQRDAQRLADQYKSLAEATQSIFDTVFLQVSAPPPRTHHLHVFACPPS